jgi:phosphatidylserine/phosphatidylglycerophosphate/cardiolipin synthase-like enzyme
MKRVRFSVVGVCFLAMAASLSAHAGGPWYDRVARKAMESVEQRLESKTVPAAGNIEIAFSPHEGAEALVLKVIRSAKKELLVMSYSFTSASITEALIDATRRGVVVHLVADFRNNITEDRTGKPRAAFSAMTNAGVDTRLISAYPISHDKVIISDGVTVETGSFNFTAAAANSNSENVIVHWNNPALADVYRQHFERNYRQSKPFDTRY